MPPGKSPSRSRTPGTLAPFSGNSRSRTREGEAVPPSRTSTWPFHMQHSRRCRMVRRSSSLLTIQSSSKPRRWRQRSTSWACSSSLARAHWRSTLRASGTWVRLISLRKRTTVIESLSTPRYSTEFFASDGSRSALARYSCTSSPAWTRGWVTRTRSGPVPSGVKPTGSSPVSLRLNRSSASLLTWSVASVSPAAAASRVLIDGSSGCSSNCAPLSAKSRVIRPSSRALTAPTAPSGSRWLRACTSRHVSPSMSRRSSDASSSLSRRPSPRTSRATTSS
ncbi:hypothetical protein SGRI78S_05191 [Streptomyces griseus subsp. griseus]